MARPGTPPYILPVDTTTLILLGSSLIAAGLVLGRLLPSKTTAAEKRHRVQCDDRLELRRSLRRTEQELNELTLFFVTLPDLIRQLNATRDKRHIAPLLVKLLDLIFEPGEICIFYRSTRHERLALAASQGLPRTLDDGALKVSLTEGRIGWVAEHQVVMDSRDFVNTTSFRGEPPGVCSRLHIDLCAPMVDLDSDQTVGVITVGHLTRCPRNEKKMIKMAADLGSMGIKNAEYHQRIQTLANEDGLTHLYNKRFGRDQLSLSINQAERNQQVLSVFLFDIDHFKNYNDTCGHLAGDEILRHMGKLTRSCIRADDFACRFGGEEFLVVFLDTDKEGGMIAAEKLRRHIEGYPFPLQERQPGRNLTISGGVAAFPRDSHSSTELIRLADGALYEAKKNGRNRVMASRQPFLSGEESPNHAKMSDSPAR
ncbi:MAG: GGDEF domain-containing protein [Acidobacteriota bacterium]